jgi:hypothetical protein
VFELKDGTQFAIYGTAWGDGEYHDRYGNSYPVDSGTIGCVLVDSIDPGKSPESLGNVIDFDDDFTTSADGGIISIGEVEIDTEGSEGPDDESINDIW